MYDGFIKAIIAMTPPLLTMLGMFIAFYFHIMNKIDERLEKEIYSKDRKELEKKIDDKFHSLKQELEILEKARSEQLKGIAKQLNLIHEHMLDCNKRS